MDEIGKSDNPVTALIHAQVAAMAHRLGETRDHLTEAKAEARMYVAQLGFKEF
jgi:hypothetical protein